MCGYICILHTGTRRFLEHLLPVESFLLFKTSQAHPSSIAFSQTGAAVTMSRAWSWSVTGLQKVESSGKRRPRWAPSSYKWGL